MEATVDKFLAFCQALPDSKKKFTFSLAIGKNVYTYSTFPDKHHEVPARPAGRGRSTGASPRRQPALPPAPRLPTPGDRRRKPRSRGALLREERRRQLRIAVDVFGPILPDLAPDSGQDTESGPLHPALSTPEALRKSERPNLDTLTISPNNEKREEEEASSTPDLKPEDTPRYVFKWNGDDIDESIEEATRVHNEMGGSGKCHFCDFSCEPNPCKLQPWYNLVLCDHLEEVHPETWDWFA
jgi:hypothetical protein